MIDGGTALVCGAAASLLEDYSLAKDLRPDADTIIINDVSEILRGDHLYSLHPEKLLRWRKWQFDTFDNIITTHSYKEPADHIWPDSGSKGSSGWSGAKLALLMGYTDVILCGVPLDPMPYTKRGPSQDFVMNAGLKIYRQGVMDDLDWHDKVTSMSGWTRELLGEPL